MEVFLEKYNINDLDEFKKDLNKIILDDTMNIINKIHTDIKKLKDDVTYIKESYIKVVNNTVEKAKENVIIPKKSTSSLGCFASKIAMDYATEKGISPENIIGTGKNNKITKTDLMKLTKEENKPRRIKTKEIKKKCYGVLSNGDSCIKDGIYEGNTIDEFYCTFHKDQGIGKINNSVYDSDDGYENEIDD